MGCGAGKREGESVTEPEGGENAGNKEAENSPKKIINKKTLAVFCKVGKNIDFSISNCCSC